MNERTNGHEFVEAKAAEDFSIFFSRSQLPCNWIFLGFNLKQRKEIFTCHRVRFVLLLQYKNVYYYARTPVLFHVYVI